MIQLRGGDIESGMSTSGRLLPLVAGNNRPILLKKSAMVCASEKYASEIEIFTFGRSFRTRISRSSVQKRLFHQSMIRQFGQADFFNRIGRSLPVVTTALAGQAECKGLVSTDAIDWSVQCKCVVKSMQLRNVPSDPAMT